MKNLQSEKQNIYLPPYKQWAAVLTNDDGSTYRWFGDTVHEAQSNAQKALKQ